MRREHKIVIGVDVHRVWTRPNADGHDWFTNDGIGGWSLGTRKDALDEARAFLNKKRRVETAEPKRSEKAESE